MNIEKIVDNETVTLKPEGWLDAANSPALGEAIEAVESAKEIILDLDDVEYIASTGVRQIVLLYRKGQELGAATKVINARKEVYSILKLTGIDKKIEIAEK